MKVEIIDQVAHFSQFQEMNTRIQVRPLDGGFVAMDSGRGSYTFTKEEFKEFITSSSKLIGD
jgi:hypothetical protein